MNKKRKTFLMASSLAMLLCACGGPSPQPTSSSSSEATSSASSSSSEPITRDIHDLRNANKGFSYSSRAYTSLGLGSSKIMTAEMGEGIFSAETGVVFGVESYLFFNYLETKGSYLAFGINESGHLALFQYNGSMFFQIKEDSDSSLGEKAALSIVFYKETGLAVFSCDDKNIFSEKFTLEEQGKIGFYAGKEGITFSSIVMNSNPHVAENDPLSYKTANGKMGFNNGKFTVESENLLAFNDKVEMENGVYEVTINTGNADIASGIVFSLDTGVRDVFWRNPASYYYLAIGVTGSITLYKQSYNGTSGTFTSLKYFLATWYDARVDHDIKVVKDGGTIYVYFDGEFAFSYIDATPLTGKKVGFCTNYNGGYYKNVKVSPTDKMAETEVTDFDVASGNFACIGGSNVAKTTKSLAVSKESLGINGTITASVGSTGSFGYGLVFRLNKPSASSYYENEEGLSYYYFSNAGNQYFKLGRYENGNVVWTKNHYVPLSICHGGVMRIVMEANTIYCYYNERLIIKYVDEHPLEGGYYGFKSEAQGGLFADMTVEKATSVDKADYLIFGHSYTHLWLHYKEDFAELGDSVRDIGLGGARTIHYSDAYAEEIAAYEPKWGIYWNGINDINADVSPTSMAANLEKFLTDVKAINPNFKCVVLGINRVTQASAYARIENIAKANQLYKQVVDKYDWLRFVDVETLFCDEDGIPQDKYFLDALHPTAAAYRMVSPLVISAIKGE